MRLSVWIATAAMVMAFAASAAAQSAPERKGPPPGGHQPPPEAFTACTDKSEGDAVTMTMPDGKTMAATCAKAPDGRLAARPDKMPDHKGPPPDRQ